MPKVIVFLDVDETCAISNRHYGEHDGGYRYNEILLETLQRYELANIYLLTSHVLSGVAKNLEEECVGTPSRLKLMRYLKDRGFQVEGNVSLLDAGFNKGIGAYYEQIIKPYEAYVLEGEDIRTGQHAKAYQEACLQENTLREQADKQQLTTKGALYQYAVGELQKKFPKEELAFIVLDDRPIYLEEITQANQKNFKWPLLCMLVKPHHSLMHYQTIVEPFLQQVGETSQKKKSEVELESSVLNQDSAQEQLLKEITSIITQPLEKEEPTATLFGLAKPYRISLRLARALLSQNDKGESIKQNNLGNSLVTKRGHVFFKNGTLQNHFTEQAVYQIARLLGEDLVAPTRLLLIQIQGEEMYPVQASLAVDGPGLDELMLIPGGIRGLKERLGEERLPKELPYLLSGQYYQDWLKKYPQYNVNPPLPWEAQLKILLEALYQLPPDKRPKEFRSDKAMYEKIKKKLIDHSNELEDSPKLLAEAVEQEFRKQVEKDIWENRGLRGKSPFHLLAFLESYPEFSSEYLVDLINLPETFQLIHKLYPKETAEIIMNQGPQVLDKIDRKQLSLHFILALLTQPQDHKGDNFKIRVLRDAEGSLAFKVIAIDNDMALEGSIRPAKANQHLIQVKTILFGVEGLLKMPLQSTTREVLLAINPKQFVIQWLKSVLEYQFFYQNLLAHHLGLGRSLKIDSPLPKEYIERLYNDLHRIQTLVRTPDITYGKLLEKVEPIVNCYYRYLSDRYPDVQSLVLALYDKNNVLLEQALQPILDQMLPNGQVVSSTLQTLPSQPVSYVAYFKEMMEFIERQSLLDPPTITSEIDDLQVYILNFLMKVENETVRIQRLAISCRVFIALYLQESEIFIDFLKNHCEQVVLRLNNTVAVLLPKTAEIPSSSTLFQVMREPQAETLVQALLDYGLSVNSIRKLDGYTSLHFAARFNLHHLIPMLIKAGAHLEVLDSQQCSPLDKALQYQCKESIRILLSYGAGRQLQLKQGQDLVKEYAQSSPQIVQRLFSLNPALAWSLAIDTVIQTEVTPEKISLAGLGNIGYLKSAIFQQLFKNIENYPKENDNNRQAVNTIRAPITADLAVELEIEDNPRYLSEMFSFLHLETVLFARTATNMAIWRLSKEQGSLWRKFSVTYPVLVTPLVQGETLKATLKNVPERLGLLDKQNFSEMVVLNLLTHLPDEEGEHYKVEPFYVGQHLRYRLIPFYPQNKDATEGSARSILYCLDHIQEPLHEAVRQRVLSIDPDALMNNWLTEFENHQSKIKKLFSDKEQKALKENQLLDISLKPNKVVSIYRKLLRLQAVLKQFPNEISLLNLLRCMAPSLGLGCIHALTSSQIPQERFKTFSIASVNSVPEKSLIVAEPHRKRLGEANAENLQLDFLQRQLQSGREESFKKSLSEYHRLVQEQRLTCIEIDCISMSLDQQKEFLEMLQTLSLVILRLHHCQALTDLFLTTILTKSPALLLLDIRGCTQLVGNAFKSIRSICPYLEELTLTGFLREHLQIDARLKVLSLKECSNLKNCEITSEQLQNLYIENCSSLSVITTRAKGLKTLKLSGCELVPHTYFYEQHPYLLDVSLKEIPASFVQTLNQEINKTLAAYKRCNRMISPIIVERLKNWLMFWINAIIESQLLMDARSAERISKIFGRLEFSASILDLMLPTLIKGAENEDERAKKAIFKVQGILGTLTDEKAIIEFLEILKDPDDEAMVAVHALGESRLPLKIVLLSILPALLKTLHSPNASLKVVVLEAIAKLVEFVPSISGLVDKNKAQNFNPLLAYLQISALKIEEVIPAIIAYLHKKQAPVEAYKMYYTLLPEAYRPLFYQTVVQSKLFAELPDIKPVLARVPNQDGICPYIVEEKKHWEELLISLVASKTTLESYPPALPVCTVEGPTIGKRYLRMEVVQALLKEQWLLSTPGNPPSSDFNFFKKKELIKGSTSPGHLTKSPPHSPSASKEAVLDKQAQRNVAQGNHLVIPIQQGNYKVHAKIRPDFPGMEIAFSLLLRRIMGEGSPCVELWRWSFGAKHYPVLLSQTISGKGLTNELLKQSPLDFVSYSRLVLISFLVNPGDGNPGNFLAEPVKDKRGKTMLSLCSIDNDRLFAPSFESGHVRVATILYCFEHMLKPVHPEIRERMLCLNVHTLLTGWLQDLKNLNEYYLGIFGKDLGAYLDEVSMDKQQSYVLSMLKEQTMREVFIKFKTMQYWLHQEPNISHLSLLSKLHGSLANFYHEIIQLAGHPDSAKRIQSPLERFEYAVGNEYRREQVGAIKKYTSSMHMKQYLKQQGRDIQGTSHIVEQWQQDFSKAQKELEELSTNDESIELAKQQSFLGDFKAFEDLPTAYAQECMIARIDFNKELVMMPKKGCELLFILAKELPINLEEHHAPAVVSEKGNNFSLIVKSKKGVVKIPAPVGVEPKVLTEIFSKRPNDNRMCLPWDHEIVKWILLKGEHRLQPDPEKQAVWWTSLIACAKLKDLEKLTINSCVGFTERSLRSLWSRLKKLRQLDIVDCSELNISELSSKTLVRLKLVQLPLVSTLNLNLPNLEYLNVSNNSNLKGFSLKTDTLMQLNLSRNPILQTLLITAPRLNEIDFSHCLALRDAHLSDLVKKCPDVKLMNLEGCGQENISYQAIKELVPALAGVKWPGGQMASLAALVEDLLANKLEKLDVLDDFSPDKVFSGLAFKAIYLALLRNQSVSLINLSISFMGDEEIVLLASMLEKNSNIKELILFEKNITDKGIIALANALENNASVGMLILGPSIGDEGLTALGKAFSKNRSLYSVVLLANKAGDKGTEALAKGLEHNNTINSFLLMGNDIGNKGACALGRALESQRSIYLFGLIASSVGDLGAAALGKALKINQHILGFGLASNSITDKGSASLIQGIEKNRNILGLCLLGNTIGPIAAPVMARVLKDRSTSMGGGLHLIPEEVVPEDLEQCPIPSLVYTKEGEPIFLIGKFLNGEDESEKRGEFDFLPMLKTRVLGIQGLYMKLISKKEYEEMTEASQEQLIPVLVYDELDMPYQFILKSQLITVLEEMELDNLKKMIVEHKEKGNLCVDWNSCAQAGIMLKDEEDLSKMTSELRSLVLKKVNLQKPYSGPIKVFLDFEHPVTQWMVALQPVGIGMIGLMLIQNSMRDQEVAVIMQALEGNMATPFLGIFSNTIGEKSIKSLGNLINTANNIDDILLWGNNIGDKEAVALAAALEGTKRDKSIKIEFSANPINLNGVKALQRANIPRVTFTIDNQEAFREPCKLHFMTEQEFKKASEDLQSCKTPTIVYGEKDIPVLLLINEGGMVRKLDRSDTFFQGDILSAELEKLISKHKRLLTLKWDGEIMGGIFSAGHTLNGKLVEDSEWVKLYEKAPSILDFLLRHPSGLLSALPYVMSFMSSSFIKFVLWVAKEKFHYVAKNTERQFLSNRFAFFSQNAEEQEALLYNSNLSFGSALPQGLSRQPALGSTTFDREGGGPSDKELSESLTTEESSDFVSSSSSIPLSRSTSLSTVRDKRGTSELAASSQGLFFSSPTSQMIDVSSQGNNCGLFALALGTKLALEQRPKLRDQLKLPKFFSSINKQALQMGTRETVKIVGQLKRALYEETINVGKKLRAELHTALLLDSVYEERRLFSFTSLCMDYLAKKLTAPDMDGFKSANIDILQRLKTHWEKLQAGLDDKTYAELEVVYKTYLKKEVSQKEIETLKNELSALVFSKDTKEAQELFLRYVLEKSDPLSNPLRNLIKLRQLFRTAWRGVTTGTALDKGELLEKINKLFTEKLFELLEIDELGGSTQERVKSLLLYAFSENSVFNEIGALEKISDKSEVYSSITSLFVENYVNDQWEMIYEKYCDHIKNSQEFLTVDELGCLARYWKVQLKIQFSSGAPYATYEGNPDPDQLHITLCNPTRIHWNVLSSTEHKERQEKVIDIFKKIQSTEFKKRLLETVKNEEAYARRTEDLSYLTGFLSVMEDFPLMLQKQGIPLSGEDPRLIKELLGIFEEVGIWKTSAEGVHNLAEPLEKLLKEQTEESLERLLSSRSDAGDKGAEKDTVVIFSAAGKKTGAPRSEPAKPVPLSNISKKASLD